MELPSYQCPAFSFRQLKEYGVIPSTQTSPIVFKIVLTANYPDWPVPQPFVDVIWGMIGFLCSVSM